MILGVRLLGGLLALSSLGLTPVAQASAQPSAPGVPSYVRTQLDDASGPPAPRGPRRIRNSLDDTNQASFPTEYPGRLIRVSLDDGSYGHLSPAGTRARRVRTALD